MARIIVYGAGAIGGVTGAALANAGHDVLLVDQVVDHVAAMNAKGLTVRTKDGAWNARVRAVTPDALPDTLDLVLVAVKAHSTDAALDRLAPLLGADGAIVSLQNGLNEERIAARVGAARTVGCLVNWAADWIEPGVILHGGDGAFVVGELDGRPSERTRQLAALLGAVTATRTSDNVWGLKWSKHVYGALLVATALVDAHVYDVVERSPAVARMLVDLVAEGMTVAKATGIRLETFDEYDPAWYWAGAAGDQAAVLRACHTVAAHYRSHTKTKTGIWRDLAVRKRKTEVEAHLGATIAKAETAGVRVPLTRQLLALIGDLETGRRAMGWANLDEMVTLDAGGGDLHSGERGGGLSAPTVEDSPLTSSARAYWQHRSPLEASLLAEVSAERLMTHVRTMGAWERESGSPGEARAYDYIASCLAEAGLEVEHTQVEALISLPEVGRLVLPDGAVIEGLAHAFSPSVDGLEADLVDAGEGTPAEYAQVSAAGKIVLLQGLATPGRAWAAQTAGTAGQVFVNLDRLHNMIVTTVWGTPTPETAWRIPKTPCLSIRRADAERLRALLARGPLRLRLVTRVRTGWIPIPHLVARLEAGSEDRFVLFSGHVDAWHHGAMDNGTANATMLEVARLLGSRRRALRRGLRLAFWSGHSHGRYAGSTWYADQAWLDLHRRCALHLYVDSVGARGATDYSVLHATEEAQGFAETVVRDVTGQAARGRRFSRAGDQSFWGIGIPSAFMALSGVPRQDTELSRTMERLFGTSGFPWWWHTREDTVDKIDADVLRLDTQVYVAAVLRTLDAPLVPIEPARAVRMLDGLLAELAAAAGRHADLAAAVSTAGRLVEKTEALAGSLDALVASGGEPARLEAANRLLLRLSRVLVPLAYTTGDRFAHDLALPLAPLAGLQRARDLGTMAPGSDAFRFAVAAVGRERNRVTHALEEAADLVDGFLSAKEPSP